MNMNENNQYGVGEVLYHITGDDFILYLNSNNLSNGDKYYSVYMDCKLRNKILVLNTSFDYLKIKDLYENIRVQLLID